MFEKTPPRWLATRPIPSRCQARIRHRHPPAACRVAICPGGGLALRFDESQWAPAPGQYVVLYDGDECLGGAVIESAMHLESTLGEVATTA